MSQNSYTHVVGLYLSIVNKRFGSTGSQICMIGVLVDNFGGDIVFLCITPILREQIT